MGILERGQRRETKPNRGAAGEESTLVFASGADWNSFAAQAFGELWRVAL
jgi:hypothetical protein